MKKNYLKKRWLICWIVRHSGINRIMELFRSRLIDIDVEYAPLGQKVIFSSNLLRPVSMEGMLRCSFRSDIRLWRICRILPTNSNPPQSMWMNQVGPNTELYQNPNNPSQGGMVQHVGPETTLTTPNNGSPPVLCQQNGPMTMCQ